MLLVAATLITGLATPALTWIGDRVAEVVVPEPSQQPTEKPTPDRDQKDLPAKERQAKRQG